MNSDRKEWVVLTSGRKHVEGESNALRQEDLACSRVSMRPLSPSRENEAEEGTQDCSNVSWRAQQIGQDCFSQDRGAMGRSPGATVTLGKLFQLLGWEWATECGWRQEGHLEVWQ